MGIDQQVYQQLSGDLNAGGVTLVAVSKTKPASDILGLYQLGQRDFGENYVQELVDKAATLPRDIRWHFIGHLQSNKVKYIAPFVHLIQGVDSLKLLKEINKQAAKHGRTIDVLLQVHIAKEETKFGFDAAELEELLQAQKEEVQALTHVRVCGLMGMASFSDDRDLVRREFRHLKSLFEQHRHTASSTIHFTILSMGMSGDYQMAVEEGSTLVRIGSLLFGARN
jgi:pyridoxal phosphate enzyme (YggS family)